MKFKPVYLFDASGLFAGVYDAQEDPMQAGSFITPTASTDIAPPSIQAGQQLRWSAGSWVVEPVATNAVPQPSLEEVKAQAVSAVRAARKPVFYTLAGMQSEALTKGDVATALAIVGIQQALKDLPNTDLSACTNAAEVSAVFVASWIAIAQSAPANVVSAFNEVLA